MTVIIGMQIGLESNSWKLLPNHLLVFGSNYFLWALFAPVIYTLILSNPLNDLSPQYFDSEENAELPAEEFFKVKEGDQFGWPYCYYDPFQKKKVLAPEYGGDGKNIGRCSQY